MDRSGSSVNHMSLSVSHVCVCVCVCRTNSDSALHTSVMNPPAGDPFSSGLRRPAGQ